MLYTLLRSVAGNMDVNNYACVQALRVDRKRCDCSKALRNPLKVDLCVCLRLPVVAIYAETQEHKVDLWPA